MTDENKTADLSLKSSHPLEKGREGGTIAFSADGSRILAPRLNGWARVWATRSGRLTRSIKVPEAATGSSFSACGKYHTIIRPQSITLRKFGRKTSIKNIKPEELVGRNSSPEIKMAIRSGFEPSGRFEGGVDTASRDGFDAWASQKSRILSFRRFEKYRGRFETGDGYVEKAQDVAYVPLFSLIEVAPDGQVVGCNGCQVTSLRSDSRSIAWQADLPANVETIRATRRGIFCLLKDYTLVILNPETGVQQATIEPRADSLVCSVALSPDGNRAAWAFASGEIDVVDTNAQVTVWQFDVRENHYSKLVFLTEDRLLFQDEISVSVYRVPDAQCLWSGTGEFVCADTEGNRILVRNPDDGDVVSLISVKEGRVIWTINHICYSAAFSQDTGRVWLLCAFQASRKQSGADILLVDAANGEIHDRQRVGLKGLARDSHTMIDNGPDQFPAISPNMQVPLIAVGNESIMLVQRAIAHEDSINGVLVLPDGRLASWSDDETIRLWDLATGVETAVLRGHEALISGALMLSDDRLASWSWDTTIRLWDLATGLETAVLNGHKEEINGVLELPDGCLVSWSDDRTLKLWNRSGRESDAYREAGTLIGSGERYRQSVHAFSLAPDLTRIWLTRRDASGWKHEIRSFAHEGAGLMTSWSSELPGQLVWGRDGLTYTLIESDGKVFTGRVGEAPDPSIVTTLRPQKTEVCDVSPKGDVLVRESGSHYVVRSDKPSVRMVPEGYVLDAASAIVEAYFSRTGKFILIVNTLGKHIFLNSISLEMQCELDLGPDFAIAQRAFSQDDRYLVITSQAGQILVIDIEKDIIVSSGALAGGEVNALFVSRDGKWVRIVCNNSVETWSSVSPDATEEVNGNAGFRVSGLPAVNSDDLNTLLGADAKRAIKNGEIDRAYSSFTIPKRSGGKRQIEAPKGWLLSLQREISFRLQSAYELTSTAHGFIPERSIVTNADLHKARRWVLNIDLKDFFPSINKARVRGIFRSPPFDLGEEAAGILAHICTRNGALPQGAPTSPVLSNFAARQLDFALEAIARRYDLTVTRYADDITFSGDGAYFPKDIAVRIGGGDTFRVAVVGPVLEDAILRNGFVINPTKTRLQYQSDRQVVTGLIVNTKLSPMRGHIKLVRALIHAWETKGLQGAADDYFERHPARLKQKRASKKGEDFRSTVYGHMSFLHMVRGTEDRQFIAFCRRLRGVDRQTPPVFVREALERADGIVGTTD